jgi:hypothetical protein
MTYNINAIKDRLKNLNNEKPKSDKKTKDAPKLQFWKPAMGLNVVRFLPYDDGNGQPFQEINYYNSKKLSDRRIVAPVQFGLPDPVHELLESLRPQRAKKEVWEVMKELQMKPTYYAPVLVRGQEEKGVQIWEMNPTIVKSIYATLTHPDWVDEDLFHAENGYDFTVEVTDSGKKFNDFVVKSYTINPRRKPEPLAKNKSDREKLVASIPNLLEHNKQYVKNEESLKDLIANFLALIDGGNATSTEEGLEVTSTVKVEEKTSATKSKIDEAFAFDDE